jgi:predicted enzyme related to lactoylglutathione lyase
MHGHIAHFAINADDLPATQAFYSGLFGWEFTSPFGPGFVRTTSSGSAVCAIQQRRDLLGDVRTNGFEVTFSVDDADAITAPAERLGGRVIMPRSTIPGVGDLVFLADPSGNVVGAMRFNT